MHQCTLVKVLPNLYIHAKRWTACSVFPSPDGILHLLFVYLYTSLSSRNPGPSCGIPHQWALYASHMSSMWASFELWQFLALQQNIRLLWSTFQKLLLVQMFQIGTSFRNLHDSHCLLQKSVSGAGMLRWFDRQSLFICLYYFKNFISKHDSPTTSTLCSELSFFPRQMSSYLQKHCQITKSWK